MILYLNYFVFVTFLGMGVIHFYWAFGGEFLLDAAIPTKEGKKLFNPGKLLTILVALILLGFAFVTLSIDSSEGVYSSLGWAIATLFTLRAIGDFNMVGFFKKIKQTKFALYDTKYFSPLCLVLGISLSILLLNT